MKPHKHAEVIKAWADGAEIEWAYATKGDGKKLWVVVDDPTWQESHEYRINLEPKPCNGFCGEQECKENQKNCERARMARKLLGSGTPQTKPLSFDVIVELGKEVDAVWDVNINGSVWFPSVDAFESFCRAIEAKVRGEK